MILNSSLQKGSSCIHPDKTFRIYCFEIVIFGTLFPGFAQENQFQLNPKDDTFGNRVTLVSDTRSIPCDVERDSTHGNQIMCYTR